MSFLLKPLGKKTDAGENGSGKAARQMRDSSNLSWNMLILT